MWLYLGYLEGVILLYKDLSCKSSLLSFLEFCSIFKFCVHCIYSSLLCYFKVLVHNIIP
jgi:hypothetical protein